MKPRGITIHCSDSPQDRGDTAETIHNWHLGRKWSGIGYTYVILEDGTIENGRPEYWEGAHARGYNDTIGICLIGEETFTGAQMVSLETLCLDIYDRYEDMEFKSIRGHYELDKHKTCPNFDVRALVAKWEQSYN